MFQSFLDPCIICSSKSIKLFCNCIYLKKKKDKTFWIFLKEEQGIIIYHVQYVFKNYYVKSMLLFYLYLHVFAWITDSYFVTFSTIDNCFVLWLFMNIWFRISERALILWYKIWHACCLYFPLIYVAFFLWVCVTIEFYDQSLFPCIFICKYVNKCSSKDYGISLYVVKHPWKIL